MWFEVKEKSRPVNTTLQYPQLNIKLLSVPFTKKNNIYISGGWQKDYAQLYTKDSLYKRNQMITAFWNYIVPLD